MVSCGCPPPPCSWRAPRGWEVFSVASGAWLGARWAVLRLWAGVFLGPWTPFLQHAGVPSELWLPEA